MNDQNRIQQRLAVAGLSLTMCIGTFGSLLIFNAYAEGPASEALPSPSADTEESLPEVTASPTAVTEEPVSESFPSASADSGEPVSEVTASQCSDKEEPAGSESEAVDETTSGEPETVIVMADGGAWKSVEIDEDHFPDKVFREWVQNNIGDHDSVLTPQELNNETNLDLTNVGISSAKGVEYFPNLEKIVLKGNHLTSLDVSRNTVLKYLDVSSNQLSSLTLGYKGCLTDLITYDNPIGELDLTTSPVLACLNCSKNHLKKLDLSENTALQQLDCDNNLLTSLALNSVTLKLFSGEAQEITLPYTTTSEGKFLVSLKSFDPDLDPAKVSIDVLTDGSIWNATDGTVIFDSIPAKGFNYSYQVDGAASPLKVHANIPLPEILPAGISLNQAEVAITVKQSVQLTATVTPSDASNQEVVWTSSDKTTASVNAEGLVTGVAEGTAVIKAMIKDTSLSAECKVTVAKEVLTPVSMYRLYNPNTGEHFYTGSTDELHNLRKIGWIFEGIGWFAPKENGDPVYRLFNPNSGDHHYTMSEEERDNLVKAGWRYEGVGWNSASADQILLYRLYNPYAESGTHHYTMSETERDNLVKAGWKYEGPSWFGMILSAEETPDVAVKLGKAQEKVDAAKQALADAQEMVASGSYGFFKYVGNTVAMGVLERAREVETNGTISSEYGTHFGDSNDATSLENMKASLEMLGTGNALRMNDNNFPGRPALKVTDEMMALTQAKTNYSSRALDHWHKYPSAFGLNYLGWGENMAWNYSVNGAYGSWYTNEKRYYDAGYHDYAGHYLNLVGASLDEDFDVTGVAITKTRSEKYPRTNTYGQNFAIVNSKETVYTADEYIARFMDYYNRVPTLIPNAQNALTAAEAELEAIKDQI